jgi:streptogramin lyase
MKVNNFWGNSRSSGERVGMIVRLGLALVAMVGSIALAWTLLGGHYTARASGVNIISTGVGNPMGTVVDSSGNIWVAVPNCNPSPACVNPPNGAIEEFNLVAGLPHLLNKYQPPANSNPTINPTFLQVDSVGHVVWFTDPTNNDIGEYNITANNWHVYTTGISTNAQPYGLVLDKTGMLWFAERADATGAVAKIGFFNTSTKAAVVESTVPTANSQPFGMTYDAANNVVWFTEDNSTKIGSFTAASNGSVTVAEHTIVAGSNQPNAHMITYDGAGHLWYSEGGSDMVGEYTVSSSTPKNFSVASGICATPPCSGTFVSGIAIDSSGLVWFDETQNSLLGSLDPTTNAINVFQLPSNSGPGEGLAIDSSHNIWVSMLFSSQVGELPAGSAPTPTPTIGSGSPSPTPTGTPLPTLPPGPVFKTWYFAEGHIGNNFQEYLTVDNPDPVNTCAVQFQYLLSSGSPITFSVNVGPNTRWTENVDQDLGVSRTGTFAEDVSTIVSVNTTTTPNCTGVVAERPMYFVNIFGVSSGHDALGATHLGTNFYFPDVASSTGFRDFITILNPPGGSAANVTATYYQGGNVLGTDTLAVASGTRGTITPKNLGVHVSAWVQSSQPVAVELPIYFAGFQAGNAGAVSGAAVLVGAQAPSNDWRFAEGYIGGKFQEDMLLSNFSTTTITASMVLEYDNGTTLTVPVTIGPQDTSLEDINSITAQGAAVGTCSSSPCSLTQNISVEITAPSGSNFVAEREMYFQYAHIANGRSLKATGGTAVIGQSGAAATTSYSFAEGYTNANYDEWLTLQNPTTTAETIYVTIVNGFGRSYPFAVPVGPQTRATVDMVKTVLNNLCTSGAPSQCWEISMTVQTVNSGGPFVAERPMYFNASSSQGGTVVLGYVGG